MSSGQSNVLSLGDMRHIDIKLAQLTALIEFVDGDRVGNIGDAVSRVPLLELEENESRNLGNPPQCPLPRGRAAILSEKRLAGAESTGAP